MFFDQMQFISYYAFLATGFPTRLIHFCRLFNWSMFCTLNVPPFISYLTNSFLSVLPLPFYISDTDHPERNMYARLAFSSSKLNGLSPQWRCNRRHQTDAPQF